MARQLYCFAAIGLASGFPTALKCERGMEAGGEKIMGNVPYESERAVMVMRSNGDLLADGDTFSAEEVLTVKLSEDTGQVQVRVEGHGVWAEPESTDCSAAREKAAAEGGVSCLNNQWTATLCALAAGGGDAGLTIWAGHAEGSGAPGVGVTTKFSLKLASASASHHGVPASPTTRDPLSASHHGVPASPTTRDPLSASHHGVPASPTTRDPLSASHHDVPASPTTRDPLSASHHGVPASPMTRDALAASAFSRQPEAVAKAPVDQVSASAEPPATIASLDYPADYNIRETMGWVAAGFAGGLALALSAGAFLLLRGRQRPSPVAAAVSADPTPQPQASTVPMPSGASDGLMSS